VWGSGGTRVACFLPLLVILVLLTLLLRRLVAHTQRLAP